MSFFCIVLLQLILQSREYEWKRLESAGKGWCNTKRGCESGEKEDIDGKNDRGKRGMRD